MAIKDLATCRLIDFTAMLHTAHLSTGYIRPSSPAFTHGQSLGRNQGGGVGFGSQEQDDKGNGIMSRKCGAAACFRPFTVANYIQIIRF